jgi:RNA polymerase sigma-70 factor (ECF subfamily)
MSVIHSLAAVFPALDSRPIGEIEQQILDELDFHIEMRTLDNIRQGMSSDEAQTAALVQFGDFRRIQKTCLNTFVGGRIMWQRIQSVLTVVLVVVVAALVAQVWLLQGAAVSHAEQASAARPASEKSTWDLLSQESPIVVETSPKHGAMDVDPATNEIRVTFDKPMQDGSWSWCKIANTTDTFPDSTGKPRYTKDGKTCVLPVKLDAGMRYIIRFNAERYDNFQDTAHRPAVPHVLVFQTARAN